MIRWREYLDILAGDGVRYDRIPEEAVAESGERVVTEVLVRWVDGEPVWYPVHIEDMNDPVPERQQRQIMNTLGLPPEKYLPLAE